ncbi:PREDICTED: fatty acid-binding protein 12-like isoform X1 [Habropoda laboriosa]|uniref:fatty acid-binding protein 12-like isoform X1 n=2 Tax=Habropoda laboriosa TaxID=597456 RepID=UPI00083D5DDE|nr:PREDICTED: fatty acid-binding protein 12-like isoform X1 [Habropoda laboriosa]
MRNLWRGEVILKRHFHQEQGDYALDKHFTKILSTGDKFLEPAYSDVIQEKNLLQPVEKHLKRIPGSSSLQCYRPGQEMSSIAGTYQHESNENLDEYFKAVGVPYIPRKMMCMSSPRLEILNDSDKWTIRTISMIRTVEVTFTLGEEYEEHMPAGVTLKNVTTMEGDSLVTVSVGPDNNKVLRKYAVTEDGVVLTMTHENSGQVAKRYFKRLS